MPTDDELYAERYQTLQARLLELNGFAAESRSVNLKKISTRIHVVAGGAGEPVLFLHGGAGIGAEHIPVAARLAKRFRVILPDRPGHGLSADFDYRSVDLRQANVDFIEALLDELGIERAALVGNSYGGFMALCFALARPERVSRLIVLSFFPGFERQLPLMMRLMVTPILGALIGRTLARPSLDNTRRFFSKLIVAHVDRVPEELVELETMHSLHHQRGISSLFRAAMTSRGFRNRYLIKGELPRLQVPTSFLWGEHDAFMTVQRGSDVARLVPGSEFQVISDAGHMTSTDQPQKTADLVARALAS